MFLPSIPSVERLCKGVVDYGEEVTNSGPIRYASKELLTWCLDPQRRKSGGPYQDISRRIFDMEPFADRLHC